jgi:hypothetical protein
MHQWCETCKGIAQPQKKNKKKIERKEKEHCSMDVKSWWAPDKFG